MKTRTHKPKILCYIRDTGPLGGIIWAAESDPGAMAVVETEGGLTASTRADSDEIREEEAVTSKTALLALIDELNAKCPFGYHDGPYPHREMGMLHGNEAERMIDTLLNAALVCDRAHRAEAASSLEPAPARAPSGSAESTWIEWNGETSTPPVEPGGVEIRLRNGTVHTQYIHSVRWLHNHGPFDVVAYRPAPARADAGTAATHRHKKRGEDVRLIGFGKMQANNWHWNCVVGMDGYGGVVSREVSIDMREVAIYRSVDDGSLWVRPREEFEDGRFEPINPDAKAPSK